MDNYNEGAIDNQINIIKNLVNGLRTSMNKFIFSKTSGDEITNYVNTILNSLDSMKNIVHKENYTESKPVEQSLKQCNKKSEYNVVLNPAVEAELKVMENNDHKSICSDYTRSEILEKIKNVFKDPYMVVQLKERRNGYLARIFNRFTNRMIYGFVIFFSESDLDNCINSAYDLYDKVFRDGVEAQNTTMCEQPITTEKKFLNKSIKRPRDDIAESESEEISEDNTSKQSGNKEINDNEKFADAFIKALKNHLAYKNISIDEFNDDNNDDNSEDKSNNSEDKDMDDVPKIETGADLVRALLWLNNYLK